MAVVTQPTRGHALPWWRRKSGQRRLQIVIASALIWFLLAAVMTPFFWMLSTALKEEGQVWLQPPQWIPVPVRWDNFYQAVTQIPFLTFFTNSVIVTGLSVLGILLSCSMVAYAFARLRAPDRTILFIILLATMKLPGEVTLVSTYLLFKGLGWLDTFKPLVVPACFGAPFYIFLLRQFFLTIPLELDEAARIDGAGYFRIYWRIVLPLAKPGLVTVAVFTFLESWSDFLRPLIYLNSTDKYTLAVGLNYFIGQFSSQTPWNWFMAASVLAMMPCLLVVLAAQRWFIQGAVLTANWVFAPSGYSQIKQFEWGVAAVPWPPKRYGLPRKMPLYPDQWMVFKGQKYPKEAWELQSWLAGPEGMRLYSQGTGLLPARKSLAEAVRTLLKGYKPGITNMELEAVLNSVNYGHITPSHAIVNWPAIGDQAVNPVFQSLQLGHLTGKQAMEQMSAKIQAVLKPYPAPK